MYKITEDDARTLRIFHVDQFGRCPKGCEREVEALACRGLLVRDMPVEPLPKPSDYPLEEGFALRSKMLVHRARVCSYRVSKRGVRLLEQNRADAGLRRTIKPTPPTFYESWQDGRNNPNPPEPLRIGM